MSKFEITEVQIDNYNDTNNQLNKFDGGLNIVCGPNEIGKSTLMNFIKNIFIRKNDAKGYVQCSVDNKEFSLRAEKNKIKDNEMFLNKINAFNYNTGFIIDLDDLMFAKKADAEELINVISDSSGNAVNTKQAEYENYIYGKKQRFPLTSKNAESTAFKKQFEDLKKLSNLIKELQDKESEYDEVCTKIDILNNEIKKISNKGNCAEIIIKKNEISGKIKNIKINSELLKNKSDFESIREEYGALNSSKQRYDEIIKKLEENKEKFSEKLKELNCLEVFSREDVEKFNLSSEIYKSGKNLAEEYRNLKQKISDAEKTIEANSGRIGELEFEATSILHQLESLNISNIDEYKTNKDMLESYRNNYSDLLNKARHSETVNTKSAKRYNEMFLLLFLSAFFATGGTLILNWNTPMRYPLITLILISVVGISTSFMERISRKNNAGNNRYNKELDSQAKEIVKLCKKCNFTLAKGDNFLVKIGSFVQNMNDKISEYKIIEKDLLNARISLQREKDNSEERKRIFDDLNKEFAELNKKTDKFLSENNIKNIENYQDVYDLIKELKALNNEILAQQEEAENYDKNLENFVKNINNFTEKNGLNNIQGLNKYDYEKFDSVLAEIRKVLDASISEESILNDLNSNLKDLDESLLSVPEDVKNELLGADNNLLISLENSLKEKQEIKGKYIQQKEDLEKVTELVALKNKKNIELNSLNEGLKKLMQKEIIFNIIKAAKEKFNESQPNLISAKKYLSRITDNKYSEIDIDNHTISGDKAPEKDWDKLSRGTKEQLYLALRLGFASNYSKDINGNDNDIPDLPLIIDDAFVNFDEKRTISILKCLEDFSVSNQVLYFTCHSNMVKNILKKENIKHNMIEL
ncbi:MAG: hypothetical protein K6E29_06320 [Cyanobacteria bacterium RUI128]|nr:hypothetical protein [Cyanobacteria bacterium RUI128]